MKGHTKLILEMKGVSKSFGAVKAVQKVDLDLHRGEIIGLVGDNAAGKSTLMKILSGVYRPDEGSIVIDGRKIENHNTQQFRKMGVEMVYQDFALAPNLSIMDNIFLGREIIGSFGFLNRRK